MYGTTEVGVILADYPGAEDYVVKPGALGKPVPGVRVEVQGRDGKPCPPNQIGEIMHKPALTVSVRNESCQMAMASYQTHSFPSFSAQTNT